MNFTDDASKPQKRGIKMQKKNRDILSAAVVF